MRAFVCIAPVCEMFATDASCREEELLQPPKSGGKGRGGSGSTRGAFFNFFKQMFGAGVLTLPRAFSWAGIIPGLLMYAFVCCACIISQCRLVACLHFEEEKMESSKVGLRTYCELSKRVLGSRMGNAVGCLVIFLELVFCTGWIIVASENLVDQMHANNSLVVLCLFPCVCFVCSLPKLEGLWFLSLFGLLTYICGVFGVVAYTIVTSSHSVEPIPYFPASYEKLPNFIGTATYGLEAILMVIPRVVKSHFC